VEASEKSFTEYRIRHQESSDARPVTIHRWAEPGRAKEEVDEVIDRLEPPEAVTAKAQEDRRGHWD